MVPLLSALRIAQEGYAEIASFHHREVTDSIEGQPVVRCLPDCEVCIAESTVDRMTAALNQGGGE